MGSLLTSCLERKGEGKGAEVTLIRLGEKGKRKKRFQRGKEEIMNECYPQNRFSSGRKRKRRNTWKR